MSSICVFCGNLVCFSHTGIRVVYDLKKPAGQRVVTLHVLCSDCLVPEFVPLEMDKVYKLLAPNFVAQKGGDGYTSISQNVIDYFPLGRCSSRFCSSILPNYQPIMGLLGRRVYGANFRLKNPDCWLRSGCESPRRQLVLSLLLDPVSCGRYTVEG